MAKKVRVRSGLAMRIAQADRLKFNEAVANGHFTCAPGTTRGSVRLFEEDDLLALYIFARLVDEGMSGRIAGHIACEVASKAIHNPEEERVMYVTGLSGVRAAIPGSSDGPVVGGIGKITHKHVFEVKTIRAFISDAIEEERNIIGGDEDE